MDVEHENRAAQECAEALVVEVERLRRHLGDAMVALARAEEHLDLIMRCYNLTTGDNDVTKFVRDACRDAMAVPRG